MNDTLDTTGDDLFDINLGDSSEDEENPSPVEPNIVPVTDLHTFDLEKEKFSVLMSILKIMKADESCQDLIIKAGRIIQMTTRKHFIFDIDLTPILGDDIDLVIPAIKTRYDMLELFKRQNVDVFFDVYNTGYTFRDDMSELNFKRALESFSEKSLTPEELLEKMLPDENRQIFQLMWNKKELDRIIAYSKGVSLSVLNFEFSGNTAVCSFRPMENVSTYSIKVLTLDDELDDTSLVDVAMPVPVGAWMTLVEGGIEEINSVLYHRNSRTPSAVMVLSGKLPIGGTDLSVEVKVWSAGKLLEKNTSRVFE